MVMNMRILVLTEAPFSQRDYQRFGIETLSKYFDVMVLDCTKLLRPGYWETHHKIVYKYPGYTEVSSWEMLKEKLSAFDLSIAIDYIGERSETNGVRKILREKKIYRAIVRCGLIPEFWQRKNIKNRIFQRNLIKRLINKLTREITTRLNIDGECPDIAIFSGESALNIRGISSALHKIGAHSFDYDLCMFNVPKDNPQIFNKYAVFLDSDFALHPEWCIDGHRPIVTVDHYYKSLNIFFDTFERITKLKVVIAAHPRSRYDLFPKLFGGRIPVMGQTAQLVKNASLVLNSLSTSVSFSIIFKKPIVSIYTEEFIGTDYEYYIKENAKLIKSPCVNINTISEGDLRAACLTTVDQISYSNYMKKYIKHAYSPNLPLWEIFSNYVAKNFNK